MNDLETALKDLMRERSAVITRVPTMPIPKGRQTRRGRSRAPVIAVAAALTLGAGAAIAKVVGDLSVTPVSDRYVIASGQLHNGPWELTLYQARVTQPTGETSVGWCLDLDGPSVNDPGASTTERANVCTRERDVVLTESIGAVLLFRRFDGDQGFLYGEVSDDVASVQVMSNDGQIRTASLVSPPKETKVRVTYFWAFAPPGNVDVIARDGKGRAVASRHLG
jgi:hypothetical protein